MTTILGLSAFYHDSAAALVVDGRIVAAAQEERFTRIKHDPAFPEKAVEYCLETAGCSYDQIDYVGFYDKPLITFERLLETFLAVTPRGFPSFCKAIPVWLKQKLQLPRLIRKKLKGQYKRRVVFTHHHESHAASAFFPSPFDEAAILTLDGVGEWSTATTGIGQGNRIQLNHELRFPHSLGLLYSAFTSFCGFKVNSGEYKLMGLAPYGQPRFFDAIVDNLIDLKEDGSFRINLKYFDYCHGSRMPSRNFERLFGIPPRSSESELPEVYMDLAASIQKVTEEVALRMANHLQRTSGQKNLVMAGGVALNCVANGRLLREANYDNIWIQPASGDAGGALGVALFIWHQLLENDRCPVSPDSQQGSFLGPEYSRDDINTLLINQNAVYREIPSEKDLCNQVAGLIAKENVVGWFQGRMEFGPRALGGRSILGDARSKSMQSVMNQKIKFRESFRPFAPSILRDHVHRYFETRPDEDSPYMLLVADILEEMRVQPTPSDMEKSGESRLNQVRSVVPAVTHVDYSARIQTIDQERHGRFHTLLEAFYRQTGTPVLINTSFNVRGEPIVATPADAYRCFMATDMDVLVLENFVLMKSEQPAADLDLREKHLATFSLD